MSENEERAAQKLKIEQLMSQGLKLHQSGQLAKARQCYRDIVRIDAAHANAFHCLGVLELQLGHPTRAVTCITEAIRHDPAAANFYTSLGLAYRAINNFEDAKAAFNEALNHNPNSIETLLALAQVHIAEKSFGPALELLQQILSEKPDSPEARYNLAECYFGQGEYVDAIESANRCLRDKKDHFRAHHLIGQSYQALNEMRKACLAFEQAINCKPDFLLCRCHLADAYISMGRLEQAQGQLEQSLRVSPNDCDTLFRLAKLHQLQDHEQQAVKRYKALIELNADYAQAYVELGKILYGQEKIKAAMAIFFKACALLPDDVDVKHRLAICLRDLGHWMEASKLFKEAAKNAPDRVDILADLSEALLYSADWEAFEATSARLTGLYANEACFEKIQDPVCAYRGLFIPGGLDWSRKVGEKSAKKYVDAAKNHRFDHAYSRRDTINIGYISPFFNDSAIGTLIGDLFVHHNRKKFVVFGYSTSPASSNDPIQRKIAESCDEFRDLSGKTDRAAAERIYKDNVHILLDIGGFLPQSRPGILAHHPAPLQGLFFGFPTTSGSTLHSLFFTHNSIVTREDEAHFSEKVVSLPETPFASPGLLLPSFPLTRSREGLPEDKVIYATLVRPYHVDRKLFESWISILSRVEDSVLWLFSDYEKYNEKLRGYARGAGIEASRLIFSQPEPLHHRWVHQLADVWLDPFLYNSTTGSLLSIWAGLPVVALNGPTPQSRTAASYLTVAGCQELVANSVEDFVNHAVQLGLDDERRKQFRTRLLKTRDTWPLFSPLRFMLALDTELKKLWDDHLAKHKK